VFCILNVAVSTLRIFGGTKWAKPVKSGGGLGGNWVSNTNVNGGAGVTNSGSGGGGGNLLTTTSVVYGGVGGSGVCIVSYTYP